ncbi:MAG: hypothetical protein AB1921_16525 [Thermodesulfobacteriota bacterium]
MKIFFDILFLPEKTLTAPDAGKRLNGFIAVFAVLFMSALSVRWVLQIGNVEGGNPALWYVIGGLLDLSLVKQLSLTEKWLVLYPIKILGDIGLILLPGYIAMKKFNASRQQFIFWAKSYGYTLGAIDVFWLIALLPAVFSGAHGRPMLVTNLLTFMVCGANIVVFTNTYRCCFRLTYERAFHGWFICGVAIPVCVFAILFLWIP